MIVGCYWLLHFSKDWGCYRPLVGTYTGRVPGTRCAKSMGAGGTHTGRKCDNGGANTWNFQILVSHLL